MIAVDTNVVVRYLVADDREQLERASALIEGTPVLVLSTVLLEVEWVLRGVYSFPASAIATSLRAFSGLPNVTIEDETRLAYALTLMAQSLDFADAFHLAGARGHGAFATFDKDLARRAARIAPDSSSFSSSTPPPPAPARRRCAARFGSSRKPRPPAPRRRPRG